jgi:LacI family transcriptional regulator
MAAQVTLAEVAAAAGVSLATASRALHGAPGRSVRSELARRVQAAAVALGYSPNANAQAMVKGTTATVGLLVHDIADPYAAAVAAGVMAAAAARGLIVTVASTRSDPDLELRHLEALHRQRARAVILAGSRFADPDATAATARQIGAIVAGGGHAAVIGEDGLGVSAVAVDNAGAASRLARVLHTLGYRRFAVLAGPEQLVTSEERLAGFRTGLADAGLDLPPENVIGAQFTRDGGYVAMTELLDRDIGVEAVFAVNDVMAVGAMAALREQGHRVPDDMAVAGFDDIPALRDIVPPLTTVRIPLADMGSRALELALDSGDQARVETISGEVVVRDSTPQRAN